MDGGDDDDGDSSGDDADDKDDADDEDDTDEECPKECEDEEEEEEHLAPADSAVVASTSGFRLPYPFHQRQRLTTTLKLFDDHQSLVMPNIAQSGRKLATRLNPDDVYSEQKIVELNYKYLNKNDIKDLYLMCLNRKIEHLRNELLKSLIVFIRSSVIWDRVHDYQLGMESYQMKVNLTSPILGFPNIEAEKPYSITTLPFVGFIYENNKKQKRIMDIDEIPKLSLSKEDADMMVFYEEYIQVHIRHRDQMRRWESYVNERPLRLRNEHPE
ncbi:hypothetical protein Tco_0909575 [Tanacetum coccineum]|uniref:Uncharacterized protein n=1 Tax=Tanacetum coccineum TaxID=301880 RepID=A0ABQ5CQJ0_9ASTR